ncbi:transposable element Tcb2 transposase [Trichonephila clavipes]|nr:transposable element Tcb2 transposase [Trichonephila clavipes]
MILSDCNLHLLNVFITDGGRQSSATAVVRNTLPAFRKRSDEDSKRAAWSDEFRFRLLNAEGELRIRSWHTHEARDPACHFRTVQIHGGSILVWGVFLLDSLGPLVHVQASLSAIWCVELLWVIPSIRLCYFVIHAVMEFISKTAVPLASPCWLLADVLEQGVKSHYTVPTSLTKFWTSLANTCQAILVESFPKVIESIPRSVADVIKTRGGRTRHRRTVLKFGKRIPFIEYRSPTEWVL